MARGSTLSVLVVSSVCAFSTHVQAQFAPFGWGNNTFNQLETNPNCENGPLIDIGHGLWWTLALKHTGTTGGVPHGSLFGWGNGSHNEVQHIPNGSNFTAIAAGYSHGLALKLDGTVEAWGQNTHNECDVPTIEEPYIAIAAGEYFSMGLTESGALLIWGNDTHGEHEQPTDGTFTAIAAGGHHGLAIDASGYLHAWGGKHYFGPIFTPPSGGTYGQGEVPEWLAEEQIVAIGAGHRTSVLTWRLAHYLRVVTP